MRARRCPQLAKSLRFNLANALAGDGERLPHLFKCVFATVFKTVSHPNDFLFAWRECLQHGRCLLLEAEVGGRI